jgi:hypothetical protein
MRSAGIVWLLQCVKSSTLLYGKCWYCVAIAMCELIDCLIWEVLVLCGYWNVRIDILSYMGSAGIVWLLECAN